MAQKTLKSNLECSECGNIFPIARKKGKQKKSGHTKHLWCIKCKEETAHIESDSQY